MRLFQRLSLLTTLLVFLAACSFFPANQTPPGPASVSPAAQTPLTADSKSFLGLPWEDDALYAAGLVKSQRGSSNLKGATIYHIALDIAPALAHIKGREEVRYTNREKNALKEVKFRLFPNIIGGQMTISNLILDGQPVTPSYELSDSVLVVPCSKTIQPGDSVTIGLDFELSVPTQAEANYGVLASLNNMLTLAHAYPMIPVYDESGWNAEIPPQSGDLTYTDASYYVVRVNAPADLTLIATGRAVSSEKSGQTQTVLFALGPARDFMLAAAKGYAVVSQTIGEVTVNSYAPQAQTERANLALKVASESLKIFAQRYAPYPYTELDVVATPTLALGVEYPGLVAIAERLYSGDKLNDTPTEIYLESTVAHEVGHQWFYNLIGNDQLDQPWLDESLTQFITWQYYADRYGANAAQSFKQALEGRWARVDNAIIAVGKPVAAYTGAEYSAIVYGRGALFFLALREQLGPVKFDAFLKDYTQQNTWNIATTARLQTLAAKSCACNLDDLFSAWIAP